MFHSFTRYNCLRYVLYTFNRVKTEIMTLESARVRYEKRQAEATTQWREIFLLIVLAVLVFHPKNTFIFF